MFEQGGFLEGLIVGILVLLIYLYFFRPGIKAGMEQSRNAKADWMGAAIPIGGVVLFVILLILLAKGG